MKKKLYELIEMAERGEKFEASYGPFGATQDFFLNKIFEREEVTADWTVRMKREPRVLWVAEVENGEIQRNIFLSSKDAHKFGEPIKFIEVIESEEN